MTSLRTLRRVLAFALDDLGIYLVGSSTTTTVILPGLVDATVGASASRYNGAFLFVATGTGEGQVRRVITNGYVPATGQLTVTPAWTTPPGGSQEIEVTRLFGASAESGGDVPPEDADYKLLVRRGLGRMKLHDRLSIPISQASTYSLAQWPWITGPERLARDERGLLEITEPAMVDGGYPRSSAWRGWSMVMDGSVPLLQVKARFPSSAGSLGVGVWRPADTLVAALDSTTGPSAELDEVVPTTDEFLPFGLMLAYQVLMSRPPGQPFPNAAALYALWEEKARASRFWDDTAFRPAAPKTDAAA